MKLQTHHWGLEADECIVCLHGLTQHGRIFEPLGRRLADGGHSVVAIDLRGHGGSSPEPPWGVATLVDDVFETLDGLGVGDVTCLVGHSFGGRVAAAAALQAEGRVRSLALLDPALQLGVEKVLRSAEIERRDWSFKTVDGGIRALLSGETIVSAPEAVVRAFVEDDLERGQDDRLRFSFSPAAAVVAWSEMALPPPPVASLPTLFVRPEVSITNATAHCDRYREILGDELTVVEVPHGHNVLWESPDETLRAIVDFIGPR
jgi:lipase